MIDLIKLLLKLLLLPRELISDHLTVELAILWVIAMLLRKLNKFFDHVIIGFLVAGQNNPLSRWCIALLFKFWQVQLVFDSISEAIDLLLL